MILLRLRNVQLQPRTLQQELRLPEAEAFSNRRIYCWTTPLENHPAVQPRQGQNFHSCDAEDLEAICSSPRVLSNYLSSMSRPPRARALPPLILLPMTSTVGHQNAITVSWIGRIAIPTGALIRVWEVSLQQTLSVLSLVLDPHFHRILDKTSEKKHRGRESQWVLNRSCREKELRTHSAASRGRPTDLISLSKTLQDFVRPRWALSQDRR